MSALEQIRKRPMLIITILGLALLLFIFTAIDRPGELFHDSHTVAKVDGQKIDYMEFQRRVEQQREQLQKQGYNNVDNAQLQQYVMNQLVNEALMKQEYQRLGLTVTDDELSRAMLGETPHPYVQRTVQQLGVPDAATLYDFAFNPTKNGLEPAQAQQLVEMWNALEKDTEEMLLQQKFSNLFYGALTANKVDARELFDENAATSTIIYARKDLTSLADDDFEVTDADVKALYDQEKNRYRIDEPQYLLDYIKVDVVPSQADLLAAQQEVETALAALRTQPGTEGVADMKGFYVERNSEPAARLAQGVKNALPTLQADTVTLVSFYDNTYTIAKLLDTYQAVDSINLSMAIINPAVDNDSILSLLNSGKKITDFDADVAQGQDSIWMSLLDPTIGMLKDELTTAATGSYFFPTNNEGLQPGVAIRINRRHAPVTVYDVAQITYDVDPSSATIRELSDNLRNYAQTNNTAAAFAENAVEAGYSVLPAVVTPSTLSVNGIEDTRSAAKWALKAKKGAVSGLYVDDRNTQLVVVALKDVYDGKYKPVRDDEVATYLRRKAMNQKKADKVIADVKGKGKTMADYAELLGSAVDTTKVTFGQPFVRNFPMGESALLANVAEAKEGQVSEPIALNASVVVFEVIGVDNSGREFDYENDAMVFNQRQGSYTFRNRLYDVLRANKKVDNRIQNFVSE